MATTTRLGGGSSQALDTSIVLADALDAALKAMNGSGVFRSPNGRGVGADAYRNEVRAADTAVDRWRRETYAVLRRHLLPDPRSVAREPSPRSFTLPVLSPGDRRAALRSLWSPFLPDARWETEHTARAGSAHVYLDVSGSMDAEMPLIVALLGRLTPYIRRPFWAFSNVVAPARIEQGRLIADTTGGTSMGCVLDHVARTQAAGRDRRHRRLHRTDRPRAGGGHGRHAPARHRHARRQRHAAAARRSALHPTLEVAVMIRMSEVVLPGHPDKFCDQVADAIVAECYKVDPRAYCQVEMSVWCDQVFLTGGIVTRKPLARDLADIVRATGRRIGYVAPNAIDADRYQVRDTVCQRREDPRTWTDHVNDQCIVIGWAGYDAKVSWLPPEHYLAHGIGRALAHSCHDGRLKGHGPDGKLLVRVRESTDDWKVEQVLVTLQQLPDISLLELTAHIVDDLRDAYADIRAKDRRWTAAFEDIELIINPNGPLLNGGSDGDNGQTGRKLVMDYYGPRVPIGGGALSGKDLSHIDRAGAYAARHAALQAVQTGAGECRVVVAYAPNRDLPLDVLYEMDGRAERLAPSWFSHSAVRQRYPGGAFVAGLAGGAHFTDGGQPWNHT